MKRREMTVMDQCRKADNFTTKKAYQTFNLRMVMKKLFIDK